MSDNNEINTSAEKAESNRVIDETSYNIQVPKESGPSAIGRGGDPLFRRIKATKEQLIELMEETQTVQDWVHRETSNNVALTCLNNENLKDIYFEIKDGFITSDKKYGKISLMGFKTPSGVDIPRLKIYDENGDVLEVLTGPMAIDELNKRAIAYKETQLGYETLPVETLEEAVIADYSGNPNDYIT